MKDNIAKIEKIGFIIFILLLSIMPIKCLIGIIETIILANNGIYTTATVLDYRKTIDGKKNNFEKQVSYDTHIDYMSLEYGKYQIGSKVPVVYCKDIPGIVLEGKLGDSAWELYKLNNNLFADAFFTIIWVVYLFYYIRESRRISKPKK